MAREKVEEASSGCILVTCGTFSFICGIIGLFRFWIFKVFVSSHFVLKLGLKPSSPSLVLCSRPEINGSHPRPVRSKHEAQEDDWETLNLTLGPFKFLGVF